MRVLVTRAADDAASLVDALRDAGHDPVLAPMIARVPDPGAVRAGVAALPAPDVLLLTSAAAARALADAPPLRPGRVAAVGPATAEAARAVGLPADVIPDRALGTELVAALGPLAGRTVLYVRAAEALPATRAALDRAGAVVTEVDAYTTVPAPDRVAALAAAGAVDVVTLTAPSVARAYADARARVPAHGTPPVVAIGPTTAEAARALGLDVAAVADPHTAAGLVAAVSSLTTP